MPEDAQKRLHANMARAMAGVPDFIFDECQLGLLEKVDERYAGVSVTNLMHRYLHMDIETVSLLLYFCISSKQIIFLPTISLSQIVPAF